MEDEKIVKKSSEKINRKEIQVGKEMRERILAALEKYELRQRRPRRRRTWDKNADKQRRTALEAKGISPKLNDKDGK